jgi:hypothetical protein
MRATRLLFASFAFLSAFFTGNVIAQQCSHHVGDWTDNYGYQWYIGGSGDGMVYVDCLYFPIWMVEGSS